MVFTAVASTFAMFAVSSLRLLDRIRPIRVGLMLRRGAALRGAQDELAPLRAVECADLVISICVQQVLPMIQTSPG